MNLRGQLLFFYSLSLIYTMIQVCEKCIEDGEKLLEEMDGEARTAPLQFRAEMLAAVRGLRLGGRCWSGWGTKKEGVGLG